jgi:hypothetical protein
MVKRMLAAIAVGTILFLLNHLGVIAGVLHPPPGYEPAWFTRNLDIPQYLTWAALARDHWLLPDYHAPWRTEPALFQPLFQMVGRTGLPLLVSYYLFEIASYWLASLALIEAARVFCENRRQMIYAALMVLFAVPLQLFGWVLAGPLHWPLAIKLWMGIGLVQYGLQSADGLMRGGLSNSMTLSFGTAIMLFSFTNLAKFVATGRRANYRWLVGCVFLGALLHPFEIFVIVVAAVWPLWRVRSRMESLGLFAAAGVGMLPYIVQSVRSDWVRDASDLAQWVMGSPVWVLLVFGMPAILLCWLLLIKFNMVRPEDQVLQSWFLTTMFLPLVRAVPGAMHLFDGFVYGMAILLVRKAQQDKLFTRLFRERPYAMRALLAGATCVSIVALSAYYAQVYRDGESADPGLFSAVTPKSEAAMIEWMKNNLAHRDVDASLVLAPEGMAPWVAAIPMPSLGSHDLFSITYFDQCGLSARFYRGEDLRRELIEDYGVSYVVVPEATKAVLPAAELLHAEGDLKLYRIPGQSMKSYSSSTKLVAAQRNGFRQWLFKLFRG